MKINPEGLALIKEQEGLRLAAYQDQAGIWTIGYGHTGKDVWPGLSISQAQADELLARDIARTEDAVTAAVSDLDGVGRNEFSAMVSLAFNIGIPAFRGSSVLRLYRARDEAAAARAFMLWVKVTGSAGKKIVSKGLTRRRAAEMALFLKDSTAAETMPQQVDDPTPTVDPKTVASGATGIAAILAPIVSTFNQVWDAINAAGIDPRYVVWGLALFGIGTMVWLLYDRWRKRRLGVSA